MENINILIIEQKIANIDILLTTKRVRYKHARGYIYNTNLVVECVLLKAEIKALIKMKYNLKKNLLKLIKGKHHEADKNSGEIL